MKRQRLPHDEGPTSQQHTSLSPPTTQKAHFVLSVWRALALRTHTLAQASTTMGPRCVHCRAPPPNMRRRAKRVRGRGRHEADMRKTKQRGKTAGRGRGGPGAQGRPPTREKGTSSRCGHHAQGRCAPRHHALGMVASATRFPNRNPCEPAPCPSPRTEQAASRCFDPHNRVQVWRRRGYPQRPAPRTGKHFARSAAPPQTSEAAEPAGPICETCLPSAQRPSVTRPLQLREISNTGGQRGRRADRKPWPRQPWCACGGRGRCTPLANARARHVVLTPAARRRAPAAPSAARCWARA